jgi:myosin heavy subunit
LDSLDEGLILHNLKERFVKERQIYTNIGTILVSINPYETYPIYTVDKIYEYRSRGNRLLDPHVYTIADEALTPLLEYGKGENHSILISGESGAGKTWNTKQALAYLTEVTSRGSKDDAGAAGSTSIEGRILAANPILEGFGNAKTIRNDNSSRFGRFTEVHFDKTGRIHGARIDNFLLEKSRVVGQTGKERSYHVFYQLTKSDKGKALGLKGPDQFTYLNKTGVCVGVRRRWLCSWTRGG